MPALQEAQDFRPYFIAHETGHVMDFARGHTRQAKQSGLFWRKHKAGLSEYGKSERGEGYAEAFAQWALGQDNETADAYAQEYGWTRPN